MTAVGANVITTDAVGLSAGEITIDVDGFAMPAYRALPAAESGLPIVIVVSEIFGVHEYIADVARRFAKLGYLAVAPELFVRQGDAKSISDIPRLVAEIVSKVPDAQALRDLDATVAWAGANGGDLARLGMTGFCWGGRMTWLYAAHEPKLKAGVAWYGRLVGASSTLAPLQPVDVAGRLHAPVLGLYGGADPSIPQETVAQMKAALGAGGPASQASQFVVYPQGQHAFHADYRPGYDAAAARDGWDRCLAWFKAHGVG